MALDINILEESFDAVAPRGDELIEDFYARLFATAPAVKALFPADMTKQRGMLLSALVLLRKTLRDLDRLVPTLHALGARHVAYGALPEHYPVVAQTLIASMAAVAGEAWTPEFEESWAAGLNVIAGAMIEGAETAVQEQLAA